MFRLEFFFYIYGEFVSFPPSLFKLCGFNIKIILLFYPSERICLRLGLLNMWEYSLIKSFGCNILGKILKTDSVHLMIIDISSFISHPESIFKKLTSFPFCVVSQNRWCKAFVISSPFSLSVALIRSLFVPLSLSERSCHAVSVSSGSKVNHHIHIPPLFKASCPFQPFLTLKFLRVKFWLVNDLQF